MHNNGHIDIARPHREFYTVTEAAIKWARAEGARSASDPRINQYAHEILAALQAGALKPWPGDKNAPSPAGVSASSLTAWLKKKYYPNVRVNF